MFKPVSTPDRIIQTSIELFNKNGLGNVSIRDIAGEAGISHSNILYHFKGMEGILDAIYSRMESETIEWKDTGIEKTSLLTLHERFHEINRFQQRYKFFYIGLQEIARQFPDIIARYRVAVEEQIGEYIEIIDRLIGNGLIRKEPGKGFYRSLFHSLWVMSTFWQHQQKILGDDHPLTGTGSDVKHLWEILLPWLTSNGLKEYRKILENAKTAESGSDGTLNRPLTDYYLSYGTNEPAGVTETGKKQNRPERGREQDQPETGRKLYHPEASRPDRSSGSGTAGKADIDPNEITIREHLQPGDLGIITWQHGFFYWREYDYKLNFEAYVASGLADYVRQYQPGKDRVWICEHRGKMIGTLLLQHHGRQVQLRYLLINPDYRGLGLGKRLMNRFMERLDQTGCHSCYLLTTPEQQQAISLYQRYGFRLTEENDASEIFDKPLTMRRYLWERH
jgi:AcrR family transcriptional regulator/ribosomal protein S18 acetylase RimI-like enzyme